MSRAVGTSPLMDTCARSPRSDEPLRRLGSKTRLPSSPTVAQASRPATTFSLSSMQDSAAAVSTQAGGQSTEPSLAAEPSLADNRPTMPARVETTTELWTKFLLGV